LRVLLLVTLALLSGASPVLAQALRAGDVIPFHAATPHPYRVKAGSPSFQVTVRHEGATYVAVHFQRFQLAPGHHVVVRSPDGLQSHVFSGRGRAGLGAFWATHIKGDQAVVELMAPGRSSATAWGFSIDAYAAGRVNLGAATPETICAPDDRGNAVCYQGSEADAYDHGRPVARLLVEGTLLCTGFLVGCEGHLLTNNHCFDDPRVSDPATAAANTDYEFLAEAPFCGSANGQSDWPGTVWAGSASLLARDVALDYAFVLLQDNPQDTYGSLVLDDRGASAGEQIYMPQHGGGRARELGLESSSPSDQGGVCRVFTTTDSSCTGGPAEVGYFCDTDGGASGTPVIAYSNHKVIALHHCGGCPAGTNTATAVFRIIDDLGALLPASALAADAVCGDDILQCGELCDGAALNGETCPSQGFTVGPLACNNTCDGFGTAGCFSLCGDGLIAPDEACEGMNLNGESCTGLGFAGGSLACDISCDSFDTSGCKSVCGDAQVSPDETCDGAELDGQSCATQDGDSGTLSCSPGCDSFGTSACCGAIDLTVECVLTDSGSATVCDGSDSVSLQFLKPSPAGLGLDVYQADEGDLFAGSIGPVTCLGNELVTGVAPGSPVALGTPAFSPALGEVAYYLVACHQCGGLLATGITRLAGSDTERLIGPACTACP
jgi:hypothetical protein